MQLNKCDFNTVLYLENNLIFQKKVTRFHFYHLRLSRKGDGDDEDVESPFPCPYDEGRNGRFEWWGAGDGVNIVNNITVPMIRMILQVVLFCFR